METSKYIRQNKGCSFLCVPRELCAAFVLLWGINPESFLYNWAIYALVVLLWAGFAMASQWKLFWQTTLHPAMLLYTASIKSFLSAPLFGIGDLVLKTVDNPREIVGGHSIVCDYLAYYGLVGSVLFHSILVTNFARIEKILDRRGRFLYLVVFVLYYVQITVNAGYNEPLIEVLFLLVPALLVLNTERCRTRTAATGDSQYIRSRAVQ